MNFTYTQEQAGKILIVRLIGELIEKDQANKMLTEISNQLDQERQKLVLELSELKYMNSSGLNVLITLLTRARKAGGDVAIAAVTSKVKDLLLITKLNTVFNVSDTLESAIQYLSTKE